MKIREVIKQLNKVDSHIIYCNNRGKIYLTSMNDDEYSMSRFKTINGKRVCRNIYCFISEEEGIKKIPELEQYCLKYESFGYVMDENNYIIPERIMNQLINFNGGIDTYQTISAPYYMMVDTMSLLNDI
jgi:hypothetical protein